MKRKALSQILKDAASDFMDSPSKTVVLEFLDILKVLLEIRKEDGARIILILREGSVAYS